MGHTLEMERVLKRVGLAKRAQSDVQIQETATPNESTKLRRRRRSKSRKRPSQDNRKTRGLFNIDWDSVKDCKSCKSRAITQRFCSKRSDNELYRSNSFKFERFIRGNDEITTLDKKIYLCDDYSLPADHLSRRRPNSAVTPSLSEWNASSPNEEKIEILETYSTPRDSKQQLSQDEVETNSVCVVSPDREYSQPYTTECSSDPSSDDDLFGCPIFLTKPLQLNSPDSIAEGISPQAHSHSPNKSDIKRHPSPYYYADLYKNKLDGPPPQSQRQTSSTPNVGHVVDRVKLPQETRTKSINQKHKSTHRKYRKSSSLDNPSFAESIRAKSRPRKSSSRHKQSSGSEASEAEDATTKNETVTEGAFLGHEADTKRRVIPSCTCVDLGTEHGLENEVGDEGMTRQKHVYETAFDCRISKSEDELEQIDKLSNHPVLLQLHKESRSTATATITNTATTVAAALLADGRRKTTANKLNQEDNNIKAISQNLQEVNLAVTEVTSMSPKTLFLPLRGYTPSPPSTAPLPTKFPGKEYLMNSIRSAPNLPCHQRSCFKDLHLPAKSLHGQSSTSSTGSIPVSSNAFVIEFGNAKQMISEFKGRPERSQELMKVKKDRILEIKDRPRKDVHRISGCKESKLHYNTRTRRHKYSSTESMTSSSGGSMESIKSSTSEGNRSTSSSGSRQSSSLSSHSSDSGRNSNYLAKQSSNFIAYANKLHILSPISDKSSQEPASETSDNNRNNNSQKCSPEEVATPENMKVIKRRLPQNKNLLNLGFHGGDIEIQGSDSGISIQSREGIKSRFGYTSTELCAPSQQDFADLPFDMPKLRRRKVLSQDACTSGSATSIDFRDLPFDMPKLRRRLRFQQSNLESNVSQASSSQSVLECSIKPTSFRQKLTLNLGDTGLFQKQNLALSLVGTGPTSSNAECTANLVIDVNLPLEKQGWFHGAITRVEAENVLRILREGSFLVRNSESTKQDYSLSLKSARGFMHMRIQKDGIAGCFILGQFSKPFNSIPEMIHHFSINRLPIRGAEHMCLLQPVIAQIL